MLANLLYLTTLTQATDYNKCYTLSFAGGASHGAYEAGVLYQLTKNANPRDITWQYISGISTGAINTSFCSQWPIGQEKEMGETVRYNWLTQVTGHAVVYDLWDFQPFTWLNEKPALTNNAPLLEFLNRLNTKDPQRPVSVGSTNSNDSVYKVFNDTLTIQDFNKAVQASAAIPGFFPPSHIDGGIYVDGSTNRNLDLLTPIQRCLEAGYEAKDVVIDAIYDFDFLNDLDFDVNSIKSPQEVSGIASQIKSYINVLRFYIQAMQDYPEIQFRYLFVPSQDLPFLLSFCPHHIKEMVKLGEYDGENQFVNPKDAITIEEFASRLEDAMTIEFAQF